MKLIVGRKYKQIRDAILTSTGTVVTVTGVKEASGKFHGPGAIAVSVTINGEDTSWVLGGWLGAPSSWLEPLVDIGDKLVLIRDDYSSQGRPKGTVLTVLRDQGNEWVLHDVVNGYIDYVSKVDIWNWFDLWGGEESPSPTTKHCTHQFVNTSFMHVRMECKHCGKSQSQHEAEALAHLAEPGV